MNILMISNYPPKGSKHTEHGSAVSSYTKNLLQAIVLKPSKLGLTVFGDTPNKVIEYCEDNIGIFRCWQNGVLYPFKIFWHSFKRRREIDVIHVQHEYFLYGDSLSAALFPLMLLLLKTLRKPIVVTLHGVIPLDDFRKAFIKENDIRGNPALLKWGLSLVTRLICYLVQKVIVHEFFLREILIRDYHVNGEKIVVFHHGIENAEVSLDPEKSKSLLGCINKRVIMFFGFITGYKGLDILIEAFNMLPKLNYILLVVGGNHPRKSRSSRYMQYLEHLKEKATQSQNEIRFTGFIREDEIACYFSAADVIVLPYTRVMSASGTFCQCITHGKAFLLSEPYKLIVGERHFIFKNNAHDLNVSLNEFFSSEDLKKEALQFEEELLQDRSWDNIADLSVHLYQEVLDKRLKR